MKGLKIYACSGVSGVYDYYQDDIGFYDRYLNEHAVIDEIERCAVEVEHLRLSVDERLERLNRIDVMVLTLRAINLYNDCLGRAGAFISQMIADGQCFCSSLDDTTRDANLNRLIEHFDLLMTTDDNPVADDDDFNAWFASYVLKHNYCAVSEEDKMRSLEFFSSQHLSGVGSSELSKEDYEYLIENPKSFIREAPGFFTYTFIPDDEIELYPWLIKYRRDKELKVKAYLRECLVGVYYTYDKDFEAALRTNFIKKYEQTPEEFIKDYRDLRYQVGAMPAERMGGAIVDDAVLLTVIIIVAIVAAAGMIASIVASALQYVATIKSAKYSAPADGYSGTPNEAENAAITNLYNQKKNSNTTTGTSVLPLIAVGACALMLLPNDKTNKENKNKQHKK